MGKSLSSIIDDLRDLSDDLERIDLTCDLEDDPDIYGVLECLLLGLPLLEEKYGTNSGEADRVRFLIDKWS